MIQIGNAVEVSLFAYDMTLYMTDYRLQKLLDLINTFNKVTGWRINTEIYQ